MESEGQSIIESYAIRMKSPSKIKCLGISANIELGLYTVLIMKLRQYLPDIDRFKVKESL